MRLLIMGPPGAGKGTQAKNIVNEYGIVHISTGDIFRKALKENTKLGIEAKKYMDEGKLVPDDLTINLVKERLENEDVKKGFLLDGFPRNEYQAKELDKFLESKNLILNAVLNLDVDDEVIIKRIIGRRVCVNCGATYHIDFSKPKSKDICDVCADSLIQRNDDKEETARTRLNVYNDNTKSLIEYYQNKKNLININGDQEEIDVFKDIKKSINSL